MLGCYGPIIASLSRQQISQRWTGASTTCWTICSSWCWWRWRIARFSGDGYAFPGYGTLPGHRAFSGQGDFPGDGTFPGHGRAAVGSREWRSLWVECLREWMLWGSWWWSSVREVMWRMMSSMVIGVHVRATVLQRRRAIHAPWRRRQSIDHRLSQMSILQRRRRRRRRGDARHRWWPQWC